MKMLLPTILLSLLVLPVATHAADPIQPDEFARVVEKGYEYLKAKQGADGSYLPKLGGPGVTALVVTSLLRHGQSVDDPVVAKGLKYLEANVRKDGGIHSGGLNNYSTAVCLMAFVAANKGGKYDKIIADATKYLKQLQSIDGTEEDRDFGGVGYSGRERPDLSNTQYFLDALMEAGVPKDDPAIQRALAFVSKCQNLPGEKNKLPFAAKTSEEDKGGFVYNPGDADNPKSERRTPEGGLRSAGVMTYAGLKSFLYAGVSKDDPRVVAALKWLAAHYTVEENPGQKDGGLYYYYHTFAKAMAALGQEEFIDAKGVKHPWKAELFAALKKRQGNDGSWVNSNRQFMENQGELSTAFALLALSYVKPTK